METSFPEKMIDLSVLSFTLIKGDKLDKKLDGLFLGKSSFIFI